MEEILEDTNYRGALGGGGKSPGFLCAKVAATRGYDRWGFRWGLRFQLYLRASTPIPPMLNFYTRQVNRQSVATIS
jgi:hypothetical protein